MPACRWTADGVYTPCPRGCPPVGPGSRGQDVRQVVEVLLRLVIAYARDNPNSYRLVWVMPEQIGETVAENRRRVRDTVEQLASLLKLGQERGVFERRDPFLAASTVLGMVNMSHILFHTGKIVDPALRDRIVEEVLSAAMLYLCWRTL